MQVCSPYAAEMPVYGHQLMKTVSMPSLQAQCYYGNSSPVEPAGDGYWRCASKWILRLRKRINVGKDTLYLAVSYLWRLIRMGVSLNEDNYEKISAALVLMSAKMNEIYPPKMSALISKCSKPVTKDDLSAAEALILSVFNFDMTFSSVTYSYLAQILASESADKLEDSEKLLGLAVTQKQIMKCGEEVVALAIVYLIKPSLVREWNMENLSRIKAAAGKIYNLYLQNKSSRN